MTGPVVCVSPNTSTDRVSIINGFEPGGTFRTIRSFDQAGGSGTHAARVIGELGGEAVAVVAIGGSNGARWKVAAEREGVRGARVEIANSNRSSYVLVDTELGKVAEVIDAGPQVTADEMERLAELVESMLESASSLVLSGSLPPGTPDTLYPRLIDAARLVGIPSIVDASGDVLRGAVDHYPWMIKPNLEEFHALVGEDQTRIERRIELIGDLTGTVADVIVLSMDVDGALVSSRDGVVRVYPPDVTVTLPQSSGINPVGCGDAMVGAFTHTWLRTGDLVQATVVGIAAAHVNLGRFEVPSVDPVMVADVARRVRTERLRAPGRV